MVDLYKEIDFSDKLKVNRDLEPFLKEEAKLIQEELAMDHLKKPFLDRSFDEFIIGELDCR